MAVFVLDKHKKPLMQCSEKNARKLLKSGRARRLAAKPLSVSRFARRRKTIAPVPSRPTRLQTFLPRSMPST